MTGRRRRAWGFGLLAASGLLLIAWWTVGLSSQGAVLGTGGVWVALVLGGVALAYGGD